MSVLLAMGLSFAGMAQKKERDPEEHAKKMTEKLAKKLELSEGQKTAVYEAHLELAKANKELKDERKAARQKFEATLKETLSEEQLKQLKAMREEMKEKRRAHRAER